MLSHSIGGAEEGREMLTGGQLLIVLPDSAVVLVGGMTVSRGERRKKLWIINWIFTCPDPSEL